MFGDDIIIRIGQGNAAGIFLCCYLNEEYKDGYLKKTIKFLKSFMMWGCMSFIILGFMAAL